MSRVAVIGGGVAGLSAAATLSRDGHEVVVFEAEAQLGYHASGRSAAVFDEHYGNDTVRALNRATRPVLRGMGVLSSRGILGIARGEDEGLFQTDVEIMGLEPMELAEARALVPILSEDVRHAGFYAGAMDIDTDAVLQVFAKTARQYGAHIVTNTRVDAVCPSWTIRAGEAEYDADIVVNSAGAWADQVAEMAGIPPIGLQPFRRSMARLPSPGGRDVRDWPMLFGAGERWYAKPDAGGWIVSPAEEDPIDPVDAWADDMVLAEGLARYEAHVTEPVTRVETNWAGLRTFAPDRTLVIGEEPDMAGFFWLAGQGGYGFQTSAGAATHLAATINGHPNELTAALAPGRFR